MNVVFVAPGAASTETSGGRGHYVEKMSRVLTSRGHTVSIVHESTSAFDRPAGGIRFIGVRRNIGFNLLGKLVRGRMSATRRSLGFGLAARRAVKRLRREGAVDVAIVMNNQASGLMLQFVPPVPVVLFCMGYMPRTNALKRRAGVDFRALEVLERWSVRTAPWIYAPTRLTATLYDDERRGKSKVRVIRTPIDPDFGRPERSCSTERSGRRRTLLFFTGHLEELKGVFVLAEAFRQLREEDRDLAMTVVGHDHAVRGRSARATMIELAGDESDAIEFVDFVGRESLRQMILDAEVVVLPSLFDNLPNTLIEALQLGAVVVGTRGASFDELIVDGESGFLAQPGSVESLVSAIRRALGVAHDPRVRAGAQAATEILAPDVVAAELEELLKEARDHAIRDHVRGIHLRPRRTRRKGLPDELA